MEERAQNDLNDVSLDTLLDVVRQICHRKLKCTFERIFASCRQQRKNVSRNGLKAVLETAVREKKVETRVTNNLPSYRLLVSNEYRVIGEVLTTEVAGSNTGVCDSVQKAVFKRKTRPVLHHARSVGLRRKTRQKRGILSGVKNLHHKRYRLRSSGELVVAAADKPLRKSRKGCSMRAKEADSERQVRLSVSDCNDNAAVNAANKSFTFSEFEPSENLHQNTTEASRQEKSISRRRKGVLAVAEKTAVQDRARSRRSVQAEDTTAGRSAVVNSRHAGRQPVVNLRRVESFMVEESDRRPNALDDGRISGAVDGSEEDTDDSSGFSAITRNIPFHQLDSAFAVHGNSFSEGTMRCDVDNMHGTPASAIGTVQTICSSASNVSGSALNESSTRVISATMTTSDSGFSDKENVTPDTASCGFSSSVVEEQLRLDSNSAGAAALAVVTSVASSGDSVRDVIGTGNGLNDIRRAQGAKLLTSPKTRIRRTQLKMLADNLSKFYAPASTGGKRRELLAQRRSAVDTERSARELQLEVIRKQVSLVEKRKKAELELAAAAVAAASQAHIPDPHSSRVHTGTDARTNSLSKPKFRRAPLKSHLNRKLRLWQNKRGKIAVRHTKKLAQASRERDASSSLKGKAQQQTRYYKVYQTKNVIEEREKVHYERPRITDEDIAQFALCQTKAAQKRTLTGVVNDHSVTDRDSLCHAQIVVGKHKFSTPYVCSYYYSVRNRTLFFCEFCFVPTESVRTLRRHQQKCSLHQLPGNEVYRKQDLSIFAIDGSVGANICCGLNQLAQFFSSHASLWHDPALYIYYVLYRMHQNDGCQFIGYISKLKQPANNDVVCILVLPSYQRCGYEKFLSELCNEVCQTDGRSRSEASAESSLWPAMSIGKSVVLNYLMNSSEQTQLSTAEKNSRTSPRGLGQSPRFSPGRLLARVCQCCEDSSRATVRKRLASQLSSAGDDDGTAVTEYKRMRYNIDPGIGSTDGPTAVIGEVVKRSRGRPRKNQLSRDITPLQSRTSRSSASVSKADRCGSLGKGSSLYPQAPAVDSGARKHQRPAGAAAEADHVLMQRPRSGRIGDRRSVEHARTGDDYGSEQKVADDQGEAAPGVPVKRGRGRPRKHPLVPVGGVCSDQRKSTAVAQSQAGRYALINSVAGPSVCMTTTAMTGGVVKRYSNSVSQSAQSDNSFDADFGDVEPDSSPGSVVYNDEDDDDDDLNAGDAVVSAAVSTFVSSASTVTLLQTPMTLVQPPVMRETLSATTAFGDAAMHTSLPVFSSITRTTDLLPKSSFPLTCAQFPLPGKHNADILSSVLLPPSTNGLRDYVAPVMAAESSTRGIHFLPSTAAALCDTSTVSSPSFARSLCAAISTSATRPQQQQQQLESNLTAAGGDSCSSVDRHVCSMSVSSLAPMQHNAVVTSSTPVMADVLQAQLDQGSLLSAASLPIVRTARLTDHTELLNALLSQAQLVIPRTEASAGSPARQQMLPNELSVPVIVLNLGAGSGSLPALSCAAVLPPSALQFLKISASNESSIVSSPASVSTVSAPGEARSAM